jgi:YhcH/YjgK/YiaL family protein
MVLDNIENAVLYFGLNKHLQQALNYMVETDFGKLAPGKYFIDGENLIANVNEYETKPASECKLESHVKYIDIQLMLEGEEQVGYLAKCNQQPTEMYNHEKDVMFFSEEVSVFKFTKGQFAIFFPTDLHQPGIQSGENTNVRKVVLKVAV